MQTQSLAKLSMLFWCVHRDVVSDDARARGVTNPNPRAREYVNVTCGFGLNAMSME